MSKCGNEILTGDIHWEMGLCNNCYNELYKDHKTHISLDKMWLKLAQDFRDENEKLQDKIADLEAKLAESEKKREYLFSSNCDYVSQIEELKQQLAEKDKEISNLNGLVRERDKQIKNLKTNKKRVIEHKNKNKISFATEQLEKVKENIKKTPITDFDLSGNFEKMYKKDAIRQIDNQIKQLKGENQ